MKKNRKPSAIFAKDVFNLLRQTKSEKTRTMFYQTLDKVLGGGRRSWATYKDWFSSPERMPKMAESTLFLLADVLIDALDKQETTVAEKLKVIKTRHEQETRK